MDEVDVVQVETGRWFEARQALHKRLLWHDVSNRIALRNPGLKSVRLTHSYDAVIAVCQNWWDLLQLNAILDWHRHCGTSVCYVDELYSCDIDAYRHWLPALARFDHIVLGMRGSVNAVERAIGKRCHHVPLGIDALRFSPYPDPPQRVIDIYSIGRRLPSLHDALVDYAVGTGRLYLYDTIVDVANASTISHVAYRDALAGLVKRSRFFLVAPAKHDTTSQTGGQQEIGYRYFEGAAAGAVMLGQAPQCDAFHELFDWPDAVVPVRADGSDAAEVLETLSEQPRRLDGIGRRNAREVLLRHDWVYRWMQVLAIAGLEPSAKMLARVGHLNERAGLISQVDAPD
ncbi:MAG: glycosyltransferase [Steroidobacteraceae bacterium]